MIEELKKYSNTNDSFNTMFTIEIPNDIVIKNIRLIDKRMKNGETIDEEGESLDLILWELKCILFVNLEDDNDIDKLDNDIKDHMLDVASYV